MGLLLSEIASQLGATCTAETTITITALASLDDAKAGDISFLANQKYAKQVATTCASAVLVRPEDAQLPSNAVLIPVDNPNIAFSKVAELLGFIRPSAPKGISKHAFIEDDCVLGPDVRVQAGAVIATGVSIGDSSSIYPNVTIGPDVSIGKNCILYPNVTIMDGCVLGDNVIINSGTVVGSDGFGFDMESPENIKIPQVGNVIIHDNVEIGSNVTIDRARFGATIIGTGVKIDNLVQIAHNVVVGAHSVVVSQAGIAGSSKLGMGVILGGATSVTGHVSIADKTMFAARSGVSKTITEAGIYGGLPAQPINLWRKDIANVRSLGKIRKSLKDLKERITEIEHQTPKNS